jgi:hypothetical protein
MAGCLSPVRVSCCCRATLVGVSADQELDAGSLSTWVAQVIAARASDTGVDVPCGSCTACCRSSYFVHVGPSEHDALRHIPATLLFPAPGLPDGHRVMGYDDRGHCPMLVEDRCSIYEHRPLACRSYDCRVFAAAGLSPDDDGKGDVAAQVRRWRFDVEGEDAALAAAIRAAGSYLSERPDCFPNGDPPSSTGVVALLALKVHGAFLGGDGEPDHDAVREALSAQQ